MARDPAEWSEAENITDIHFLFFFFLKAGARGIVGNAEFRTMKREGGGGASLRDR